MLHWVNYRSESHIYLSKLPEQVNEGSLAEGISEAGMKRKCGVLRRENRDPTSLWKKNICSLLVCFSH